MEENGLLNMDNPIHKSALHYVFLASINRAMTSFKTAWNNHPLRNERNWSPQRIWSNGMVDIRNHTLTAVADVAEAEERQSHLLMIQTGMDLIQLHLHQ